MFEKFGWKEVSIYEEIVMFLRTAFFLGFFITGLIHWYQDFIQFALVAFFVIF